MSDVQLNEMAVALLGSVDLVDLNGAPNTETPIFTVPSLPTAKKCVLHSVGLRNLSASCASATAAFGAAGGARNFLGTQTLSALNAAGKTGILMPVPNATTVVGYEYEAGVVLVMKLIAAAGIACTATVDFFGTLDDA
jgi:hypothetical protein